MLKLIKFLKSSALTIVFVILLLILQANCDLALPTYTSDIVNTGIMKHGIKDSVPNVIRKTELDKIKIFMTPKEQDTVLPHFSLMKKSDYSEKEWSDYLKKYPVLKTEPLYKWDGKEEDTVSKAMGKPVLLVMGIEGDSDTSVKMREQILSKVPKQITDKTKDIFTIFTILPKEAVTKNVQFLRKQEDSMPEIMITQSAVSYVKEEYTAVGINMDKLQVNYVLIAGAKMLALAFVGMLAAILVVFLSARIAAKMGLELRGKVFKRVLSFSNKEMDQFSTASLITRSTNDIQQVQMMMVMMIRIVFYAPILAIGGIIKVVHTNSSMSWILIVAVGAIFFLIGTLMVIAMPKFKKMQSLIDRINLVTREILTGLPVIRAFSTVKQEEDRFDKANINLTKNTLFVNRAMTFMMPALMLIMNFVSILILWVGADKIDAGTMQIGDMIAFIQYTMQIIMSFLFLTMLSIMLPRASVAAGRIDEILLTKTSIKDPKSEASMDNSLKGILEFRNVSFRYPNAEEDVLSDINFVTKPGETTAIIGSTGSGKSTLINLIPRFYDATAGTILINGTDITKVKQDTLRKKLGFIPQKGVLFTGTIESNIKFGAQDASEDVLKRAARIAQAEEFIDSKPEGYAEHISQGGTNVSGGQKQRLSIARAIAKNPDIYVFDDSFSALDYKTDAALRKAIKEEISDSTVIIVAQRISTIMHAEQILVLDEGRIVGKGTHQELLKNCEVYQQIAASQLSKEELANE
jgi:ABC-type multidrug transport system, ATPase and permease components